MDIIFSIIILTIIVYITKNILTDIPYIKIRKRNSNTIEQKNCTMGYDTNDGTGEPRND